MTTEAQTFNPNAVFLDIPTEHLLNSRVHFHFPEPMTEPEARALYDLWREEFGLSERLDCVRSGNHLVYFTVIPAGRRMYALLPAMIRKAKRLGYQVSVSCKDMPGYLPLYEEGNDGTFYYITERDRPQDFWKILALAQMWHEDPKKS